MAFGPSSRVTILVALYTVLCYFETSCAASAFSNQVYSSGIYQPLGVTGDQHHAEYEPQFAVKNSAGEQQGQLRGKSKKGLLMGGALIALIALAGFGLYRAKAYLNEKSFYSDISQLNQASSDMNDIVVSWLEMHEVAFDKQDFLQKRQKAADQQKKTEIQAYMPSAKEPEVLTAKVVDELFMANDKFILEQAYQAFTDMKTLAVNLIPEMDHKVAQYDVRTATDSVTLDHHSLKTKIDEIMRVTPVNGQKLEYFLNNAEKLSSSIRAFKTIQGRLSEHLTKIYKKDITL